MKRLPPSSVPLLALLCAAPLAAQEAAPDAAKPDSRSITFSAGVGATDNVTRSATEEESATILSAGLRVDVDETTRRLDTEINGNLDYLHYLDDVYDDEVAGRMDANLRVGLSPGRVFWDFNDNYGQAQISPFAPVTPGNRESVNYFSTGPIVIMKLGEAGFAELGAHYSDVAYETSPLDSQRLSASAAFGREFASGSRASLNVDWQQLDFDDDTVNTDYDLISAYARYEVKGSRTEFSANAGVSQFDDGENDDSGPFVQLELTRHMSSASTLKLDIGQQFTDAAGAFRDQGSLIEGQSATSPAPLSSDAFERTYGDADWRYQRHRTGLTVAVRYSDDDYETRSELDVARLELLLSLDRQITPALSGRVYASHTDSDYKNSGFEDRIDSAGLGASWLIGRHLTLSLDLRHEQRNTEGGGNDYDETQGFLTLGYRVR